MSITRVNPGNWSVGDKLSSSQLNSIDTNVTNALDKRSGQTDTVSSTVSWGNGSQLVCVGGSTFVIQSGATSSIANTTSITGKIQTNSGGRLELNDNDYVNLGSTHTGKTRSFIQCAGVNGFVSASSSLTSVGAVNLKASGILSQFPRLQQGATLTSVTAYFEAPTPHLGTPTFPNLVVSRKTTAEVSTSLGSTAVWTGTLGAYETGIQSLTFTCSANNVIDVSTYYYAVSFTSESGANSLDGLLVLSLQYNFTVTNVQPA